MHPTDGNLHALREHHDRHEIGKSMTALAPDESEALMFAGITPPERGYRTTCPDCSHKRRKKSEKCLKITREEWGLEWVCKHCGYQDGVAT